MAQGFPGEAIHHALASGDATMLRDVLLKHAWTLFNQSELPLLENSLKALPWEMMLDNPMLVLLQALPLVGVESLAHLYQIPPVLLEVLMTFPIQIALTQLAQKMLYLPEDLPLVLYFLSQLDARPSLVTSQP